VNRQRFNNTPQATSQQDIFPCDLWVRHCLVTSSLMIRMREKLHTFETVGDVMWHVLLLRQKDDAICYFLA